MLKPALPPTVVDLFSGVGGLSLGAARAGFRVAASVELDPIAAGSHSYNFPTTRHLQVDVASLSGEALLEAAGIRLGALGGLIGGPPCQGFSLIGRQHDADPRNDLFGHFFRLVAETRPAFYVAENVPGVLGEKYRELVERALAKVPKHYTQIAAFKVEAHKYGAPTTRTRIFFVGFDPDRMETFSAADLAPANDVQPVLVGAALRGLTPVRPNWQTEPQSWRLVKDLPDSPFFMRVKDAIPQGVGNSDAIKMLREKNKVSGFLGTLHASETIRRFEKLKPGQIDPIYRSPRLDPNAFCPTLRAGTNRDHGSYQAVRPIHPRSARVISPREAARLQGFPDWFVFHPTKWHSFRQIGNSVSPIVAERLLAILRSRLT